MRKSIVSTIPGGWYGSDPGFNPHNPKTGHVAVNPDQAHYALDFLRHKRAIVNKITVVDEPGGHSLLITYDVR
uniref:Uncharacterized protein n=1 Tax=viral metagenome TaxID=1070528 RepID=A0A6M3JQ30_9ZZZZ